MNFIKLISIYYYKTEDVHSDNFKGKVNTLLKVKTITEDVFTISFYSWLIAKIEQEDVYKTTLEYIRNL